MGKLAFLLYPFALLYGWITWLRNWLYDRGLLAVKKSPIRSILVGNLSVGGTGKTPMVEYLIRQLSAMETIATLSRGYGRKTKGYIQAGRAFSPQEIGDEPLQIYQKYGDKVSVHVCEDRAEGARKILDTAPDTTLLLLDDAFQHRSFAADLGLLLTAFARPFTEDYLLPMGRLREYRSGAKRADAVVVTKCPADLTAAQRSKLTGQVRAYAGQEVPVLFSKIGYGDPYKLSAAGSLSDRVILVSGIADDTALEYHLKSRYEYLDKLSFGDHHEFDRKDMESVFQLWKKYQDQDPVVFVTEKDAEKVKSLIKEGFLAEIPIFVQPIEVQFSQEDEGILRELIAQKLN